MIEESAREGFEDESSSLLTNILNKLLTTRSLRMSELHSSETERKKVANILTVLSFFDLIVITGEAKNKIVRLNCPDRLKSPIVLRNIEQEIEQRRRLMG